MTWTTRPRSEFGSLAAIRSAPSTDILLIHGVGLRAEAWNAQIDALSRVAGTTAVDLPGHGDSPGFERPVALTDYSDAVAQGIDQPVMVVGHSMGALIALDLAIRYPDRIKAVAALNTIFQRSAAASAAVKARAEGLDGRTPADPEPTLARWFWDTSSDARTACDRWLTTVDPKAYQTAYRVFAHENGPTPEDLARLKAPAVFATGADEFNSTPDMSQRLAQLVPHGTADIVEGAAHMMPMTHPDRVNAALLQLAGRVM